MTALFNADRRHQDYSNAIERWETVGDCIQGQQAVKSRRERYLTNPYKANKNQQEQKDLYNAYLNRAMFLNVTSRTLDYSVGAIFRNDPKIELSSEYEYLLNNADGSGLSLIQQVQKSTREMIGKGRCGLLVDFIGDSGTRADIEAGRAGAFIQQYDPEDIRDWVVSSLDGGPAQLVYLLLREIAQEETGSFNQNGSITNNDIQLSQYQYRECFLDPESGEYQVVLHRPIITNNNAGVEIAGFGSNEIEIRGVNGQPLLRIPFAFGGSQNNSWEIDRAPLYDLAVVNLSHYQNSADNENASFLTGQSMLVVDVGQTSDDQFKEQNPNGIIVGSNRAIVLRGGSAQFIQAASTNLPRENMRDKETQMLNIGAQLFSPSQQITAESARIQHASDTSELAQIAKNVDAMYMLAFEFVRMFMGGSAEDIFETNKEFMPEGFNAQDVQVLDLLVDKRRLAIEDLWQYLRSVGVLGETRTDDSLRNSLGDDAEGAMPDLDAPDTMRDQIRSVFFEMQQSDEGDQ